MSLRVYRASMAPVAVIAQQQSLNNKKVVHYNIIYFELKIKS